MMIAVSWLSPRNNPRLEPLFESVQRSLDEILQLEVELIEENTEVDPELWIHLFAARFRSWWINIHKFTEASGK